MTFPTVSAKGTMYTVNPATSHALLLPARAAGDLLIALFSCDGSGAPRHTWDSDWIKLAEVDSASSHGFSYGYRIATNDAIDNLTITTPNEAATGRVWCVTGWHGTTPPEHGNTIGNSQTPDPPSVTPSWGAADTLVIVFAGANGGPAPASVWPYTMNQEEQNTGGGGASGHCACNGEVNASPIDPGTFTIAASAFWEAATILVRPAAGGGPTAGRRLSLLHAGH